MRTETEITAKLESIQNSLSKLEKKWVKTNSDKIQIEFHKNNIAFIEWALGDQEKTYVIPIRIAERLGITD